MMVEAGILLSGIIIGYTMCYLAVTKDTPKRTMPQEDNTVLVKRSRVSLRNPLQTNRIQYEKYKTRDTGLYSPVKPKKKAEDNVEVGN